MLSHTPNKSWNWVPLFCLYFLAVSCANEHDLNNVPRIYFCDVELDLLIDEAVSLVDTSGFPFMGVEQKNKSASRSGEYSLLLDSVHQFGFGISLDGVKPGEVFTIESWQSTIGDSEPCALVASNEANSFYHSKNIVVGEKDGWKHVLTRVYIPKDFKDDKLSFYVWTKGQTTAYVDDFRVTRYNHQTDHSAFELEKMHISIDEAGLSHISTIRDSALVIGILKRGKDDYVPVNIVYQGQGKKGKIRLKGDWADHFKGDKWSFRIKLDSPLKDGVKVFSVQAPQTRDFLNEYIYHKILEGEDVLSPEYRFIQVFLNGTSLGIYAFEEHLSSRIIDRMSKPNGVILKFDDKLFWDLVSTIPDDSSEGDVIVRSKIKIYGKSNKDKKFKQDIKDAKLIMKGYQHQDSAIYNSFNIHQMAKYYALCDLSRAYHAMFWVNIRFYYNFSTKMMEPIGYDGFTGAGARSWASPYLGYAQNHKKYSGFKAEAIVYHVFLHPPMTDIYTKYITDFTDSSYVRQRMNELAMDLDFYESQIRIEYPFYSFDRDFLFNNAREIRAALVEDTK